MNENNILQKREKLMKKKQPLRTSNNERIAIVSGLRTPFAKQLTYFQNTPALDMGKLVVSELMQRAELDPELVDQVVFGQVIQTVAAPNIAREIVLGTGMRTSTDAYSVTRACATSLQSTVNIAESIMAGAIDIGIAGGADSSSVLPVGVSKKLASMLLQLSRTKTMGQRLAILKKLKLRDLAPVPPAVAEYSTGLRMGDTAEQMAKTHGISRNEQDKFAFRSHSLAAKAWEDGKLNDEVMVAHAEPFKEFFEKDNTVRADSTLDDYKKLRPVFDRRYGSVTAGNSSPLTDGAAAVLLMREGRAKELGYQPLGYLKSYAFYGIEVKQDMLMGPSYATPVALDRAGMKLSDIDLIEMHEAFAAQTLANVKMFASDKFAKEKLGRSKATGEIDMDKFNVIGSSIAYGHPFAATGARMITQNLQELKRRGEETALITACAAGGLGAAMILEAA